MTALLDDRTSNRIVELLGKLLDGTPAVTASSIGCSGSSPPFRISVPSMIASITGDWPPAAFNLGANSTVLPPKMLGSYFWTNLEWVSKRSLS